MSNDFRAAALSLLIPCDARWEQQFLDWLSQHLYELGVAQEDHPGWIKSELLQWQTRGTPSRDLQRTVKLAIFDPSRESATFVFGRIGDSLDERDAKKQEACSRLAKQYMKLHKKLQALMLTHDEARLVLSYAGLMISFAVDYRMSSSEISRILGARDRRLALNWYPIRAINRACGCWSEFGKEELREAYGTSRESEASLLADLSIDEAVNYVGSLGLALGCGVDFEPALAQLLLGNTHDPYLLILHFQLSSLAQHDHAVTFAYEFSPRGQAVDWLVEQYQRAGLSVKSNPYLNNAKALLRFDRGWAWGRDDHLPRSHALVTLLQEIESLGPLPKAELARYVLAVLHRILRISWEQRQGRLPEPIPQLDSHTATELVGQLAQSNSATNGILEQRLVDALTTARHREVGWSVRGRGDSVFAPSTFRKKLGDIEFMRIQAAPPKVIGYESHGGHLTMPYVRAHITSFDAILRLRRDELEAIAPLNSWTLETVFVSHTKADGLPSTDTLDVDGLSVELRLRYATFTELAAEATSDASFGSSFQRHFVDELNQYPVPSSVRKRVLDTL